MAPVSGPPVTEEHGEHSNARIGRKRLSKRLLIIAAALALAAGVVPALKAEPRSPRDTPYPVKWYPFTGHPDSDTCWSLSVGPDGRIYAAACAESLPGGVVKPVRYNEQRDYKPLPYYGEFDKELHRVK